MKFSYTNSVYHQSTQYTHRMKNHKQNDNLYKPTKASFIFINNQKFKSINSCPPLRNFTNTLQILKR